MKIKEMNCSQFLLGDDLYKWENPLTEQDQMVPFSSIYVMITNLHHTRICWLTESSKQQIFLGQKLWQSRITKKFLGFFFQIIFSFPLILSQIKKRLINFLRNLRNLYVNGDKSWVTYHCIMLNFLQFDSRLKGTLLYFDTYFFAHFLVLFGDPLVLKLFYNNQVQPEKK